MNRPTGKGLRRAAGEIAQPSASHLKNGWARLIFLAVLALGGAAAAQDQEKKPPEKVGSEICMSCHDMEPVFSRSLHARQECESCHGPGSAHVEAGGDLSLSFTTQPAGASLSRCLTCHGRDPDKSAFKKSAHGRSNTPCVACHQIHPPGPNFGLLKSEQKDLCLSCHPSAGADFRKPFHHPVLEDGMKCSDCHTPHAEDRRPSQRLVAGTEQGCVSCHSDKQGPFLFEHAAIKVNGCESCHQPHGSINAKMLRRSEVSQLCLECHSATSGAVTVQPPAFHDLRTARFRNCTTCHREIHGSNASPLFLR